MENDWRENYWKVEAGEHGDLKAANIDHLRPSEKMTIFLMEQGGEL